MSKKKAQKTPFKDSILKNLFAIIIAGIILIIIGLLFLNVYTRHGENVEVPLLNGLQVSEAETILKSKGLNVLIIDSIYDRDAVPGSILDQTPKPKNKVKEGRSIYLTIYAYNPEQLAVPGLTDFSVRQATAMLNSMGFTELAIEEVPSQYAGLVIAVQYRGRNLIPEEKIPAGSPLKLIVGSGMEGDSLNVHREYVVPPGEVGVPQSTTVTPEKNEGIDDTFF